MQKAVVIVPTYNERENIQKLIPLLLEVFKKVKNWDMSILVVDDTSPDKTYEVVKKITKENKKVKLLLNAKKEGLGGAYLKGMDYAFGEQGAEVVLQFDADLSHDHRKIPQFMKEIDGGEDLVLGSRYVKGGGIPANWGLYRKFLSVVGNITIATVLTNFSIRDWTTGFRAVRRKVFEKVRPFVSDARFMGYTYQIGFLNSALRQGFKVKEVPFIFVDRTIGKSKLGAEYMKNTLLYIFKLRLDDLFKNRIFKFAFVGGIGTLVQLMSLTIIRLLIPDFQFLVFTSFLVATLMSIELAIISNFVLNNLWTFADRKLMTSQIPGKFIQFNLASMGSILIQLIINSSGENFIGLKDLFVLPIINFNVDTGLIFAISGILIGLFWNFFAYNKYIWKKK
ncbi:glycosyltransferase family 2 protein [Patescibacteria group bacterium]|nr:glycosyltransferase family 2 protein [Patescibacteria group bacterium]